MVNNNDVGNTEVEKQQLRQLNYFPQRKPRFTIQFFDDPELFSMIDQYRRTLGWTWKRMLLVGFANTVARQNDNPDLVIKIAEYLSEKR